MDVGLYIHIPFCRFKCSYCDFNAYAGMRSLYEPYAQAVAREIRTSAGRGHTAHSVFFGGGTPSLLPLPYLDEILAASREVFGLSPDAEVTLEANPGTVDQAYLEGLRALGVNRLSLGVESVHQSELDFFKRGHSFQDAVESMRLARQAGFDNINFDLIYGVPYQTMDMWQETVRQALNLEPEHMSLYCLTVEDRTTLALWVRKGKAPLPDDDLAADMVLWAEQELERRGLARYEVANWARGTARRSRHNLVYWHNAPYLGFGAGAHSSFGGRRFWNVAHPREYARRVAAGETAVVEAETIGRALEMGETMMLGLRLTEGVAFTRFRDRFGDDLREVYARELSELAQQSLIEMDDQRVRLTRQGWLLGNRVFGAFLPDEEQDKQP